MNTAVPLLVTVALATGGGADEHLLAGARYFADGRYENALVEFQVAQRLGSAEGAAYAGATLVELERWEDAVEAFAAAPPPGGDPLLDYYRARACYGARLYFCADAILAGLGDRSGPVDGVPIATAYFPLRGGDGAVGGHKTNAARILGITRRRLYTLLASFSEGSGGE